MRRPLIAGNWKMNLGRAEALALTAHVATGVRRDDVDVAIYPPSIWLTDTTDHLLGSHIIVGAQNCSRYDRGAYTGQLSALQVAEVASSVLLGHSERRQKLDETDSVVRSKVDAALAAGLMPVLCVGEVASVRNSPGEYVPYVMEQVRASLAGRTFDAITRIVVAYEPVWAIRTGVAATPADAQEMTEAIRHAIDSIALVQAHWCGFSTAGSVTPANAAELLAQPDVDGVLVGGASLNAADFLAIVEAVPRAI